MLAKGARPRVCFAALKRESLRHGVPTARVVGVARVGGGFARGHAFLGAVLDTEEHKWAEQHLRLARAEVRERFDAVALPEGRHTHVQRLTKINQEYNCRQNHALLSLQCLDPDGGWNIPAIWHDAGA